MATSTAKSERIDLRASRATKDVLRRAAARRHQSVSEFLLDAGLAAAEETLADRRDFALDPKRWRAFLAVLDRPARAKPRLARLLAGD
ncbi:MAG: DUF1778 domain-containing protein [Alphaproteobacteria bacterium]|nr:DUF1778 domain-containing protein [Alphaproteobacteria bacterium]